MAFNITLMSGWVFLWLWKFRKPWGRINLGAKLFFLITTRGLCFNCGGPQKISIRYPLSGGGGRPDTDTLVRGVSSINDQFKKKSY